MSSKVIVAFAVVVLFVVVAYTFSKRSYFSSKHPLVEKIRTNFALLNPEYAKIPIQEGNSAFTENKEMITMCLQDPKTKKYYDMNTLTYVALHELAHVVNSTHGHDDEFKKNFAKLLERATQLGIYDPTKPLPEYYCGVKTG